MKVRIRASLLPLPLLVLSMLLLPVGCQQRRRSSGELVTEQKKATVAKAEMLRAEIKMAAGELTVEGGGKDEVSAEFRYRKGEMVPVFKLDNTSFRARLTVEQSDGEGGTFEGGENVWKVKLADGVATDLSINMGAGDAMLRLGSLDLRSVSLNIGAGKVSADLVGQPLRDYEVKIRGGVGDCEIFLPKQVGLRADVQGGIGSIDVVGLEKKNGAYENAEFATGKVKIRLSAQGGVGSIRIVAR